jgi:hypothetical protein
MAGSAQSNRLTLVKPRSTWVITLKTEPTTPINPLDQVNTPLWSTFGQRHGQTPLKPWRRWMSWGLLEDCVFSTMVASPALYWPADEVGSQTPGQLRPGDLSLRYTSCLIPSICFGQSPPESCLVRQVLRSWGTRSSGESSGRSSGGRMGCQLGRLGPLTGRQVFQ